MPRVLGITGNIASGKTTVGRMLLELGAERYIDADAVVHTLYEAGQSLALAVAQAFGPTVMLPDGSVDRKALGALVFQDAEAMKRLESLVHPAVGVALLNELSTVSDSGIAIIDAVKLLEGGSGALCQSKWLVICSEQQQLVRLMSRNGLSEEQARMRISAQPSLAEKIKLVDEVIDNSGSLAHTRDQVSVAFAHFSQRFPR